VRIGLINEYFPPHAPGGAEWSTYYLGKRLAEAGYKVVVITPNYGASEREEREGMKICRFWFPQKLKKGYLVRSSLHSNSIFYLYSSFHIWHIARQEQIEVLHAQGKYSLPGTFIAARLLRIPVVVTLRDMQSLCASGGLCLHEQDSVPNDCGFVKSLGCLRAFDRKYNPHKSLFYRLKFYADGLLLKKPDLWLRSWFLKRVDKVITISDALRSLYIEAGKIVPERAETIYNFPPIIRDVKVDSEQLRCKYGLQGKKTVLTVGKMSFGKGTDVLIEAVPKVLRSVPDAIFVLVGRENPLIVIPKHLQNHIRVLGVLPHEEVLKLYALADLVVTPSVWQEPHGRVPLEALSLSKPVVATRVGGIPETVENGVSGLLVERNDSKSLAEAIAKILLNPELGQWIGENGRLVLENKFDKWNILQRTLNLYQDALTRKEFG
jgi:glycosyltransferase involved in cell wall biosynthesis